MGRKNKYTRERRTTFKIGTRTGRKIRRRKGIKHREKIKTKEGKEKEKERETVKDFG